MVLSCVAWCLVKHRKKFIFTFYLMDLSEIRWEDVDWIRLAQDRYQWRAVVNMGMNLLFP